MVRSGSHLQLVGVLVVVQCLPGPFQHTTLPRSIATQVDAHKMAHILLFLPNLLIGSTVRHLRGSQ